MLISYCVRLIVMTTPLHCLKFIHCRMLSMAELLIKMFIHTTALKLHKTGENLHMQPAPGVVCIHQDKTGVTGCACEESQIRQTHCL